MGTSFTFVRFGFVKWSVSIRNGPFLVRFPYKLISYLVDNSFYCWRPLPEPFRMRNKRPMRVGKNEAGGPEKQVILFVWPNIIMHFSSVEYYHIGGGGGRVGRRFQQDMCRIRPIPYFQREDWEGTMLVTNAIIHHRSVALFGATRLVLASKRNKG